MKSKSHPSFLRRDGFKIILIILLGFCLRLYAIDFGLPHLYHADEPIIVNHALAYGSGNFNPKFFNVPPLVSYVLFFIYGLFFITGKLVGSFDSIQSFANLFLTDPTVFYLVGRVILGSLFGTFTIVLLFRGATTVFSKQTGIVAALLLAINFLHVCESHYIYVDIPLVALFVYTLLKMCGYVNEPLELKQHYFLGVLIGLATALKYNGAFLFIPYVAMLYLQRDKDKNPLKHIFACAFSAGCISLIVFFTLNPFSLLDFEYFLQELAEQNRANSGGVTIFHHFVYSLVGAMGMPALLLSTLSFFCLPFSLYSTEERKKWIILWTFILSYYIVLIFKSQPYSRYVLPLIPFLCLSAGDVIIRICQNISSRYLKHFTVLILIVASMITPTVKSIQWDLLMGAEDTRTMAKEWIETNIPSGASMALDWDFYMPRLNFTEQQLMTKMNDLKSINVHENYKIKKLLALIDKSHKERTYNLHFLTKDPNEPRFLLASPILPFDLNLLKKEGVLFVAISESYREKSSNESFFHDLKSQGHIIARFSPYKNSEQLFIDNQPMTGGPFLWNEIMRRERNGLTIVLYEI